jgi:hypothetical protein
MAEALGYDMNDRGDVRPSRRIVPSQSRIQVSLHKCRTSLDAAVLATPGRTRSGGLEI